MRRPGLAAIFLVILLILTTALTAFASAEAPEDVPSPLPEPKESTAAAEPSAPEDPPGDRGEPTSDPSEPVADEPSADPSATAEPSVDPDPTEEPSLEPSPTEPPATQPPAPSASAAEPERPTLEVASGQTIYLHQETPSIKVRWKSGIPDSVSGYVWSYSADGGAKQVFYVTYDANSTTLAAGALNGHIVAAGRYTIQCQPVDAEQEPATPPAQVELRVEQSSAELTITANRSLPVPAGSELTLTADVGSIESSVSRFEWKPGGNGSGGKTCKISAVAAGPVRYTCTAVLQSGQRVTGTLVVTGTELIATQRSITLGSGDRALSVAWSNGTPAGDIEYKWSVRGETGFRLKGYDGTLLPSESLRELAPRDNPYTVSCQAYVKDNPISTPATFQVRVNGHGVIPSTEEMRSAKFIVGDANGKVPDTDDRSDVLLAAAIVLSVCAVLIALCWHRPYRRRQCR